MQQAIFDAIIRVETNDLMLHWITPTQSIVPGGRHR